jgi:hypothetical protein
MSTVGMSTVVSLIVLNSSILLVANRATSDRADRTTD